MSDTRTFFVADEAAAESPAAESLSPRSKALVIIVLSLAAWVPVVLPLMLLLRR